MFNFQKQGVRPTRIMGFSHVNHERGKTNQFVCKLARWSRRKEKAGWPLIGHQKPDGQLKAKYSEKMAEASARK